jgi:hypothetical protein
VGFGVFTSAGEHLVSLHHTSRTVHGHFDRGRRQATSGPDRLVGAARREWEEQILADAGLKGSRLHLARVLLEEFCWGKCWCIPGDELLARKCGIGTATVTRCLRDLARLGTIRIIHARGRRRLVFPSHPHAEAYLREIGADVPQTAADPLPADQSDGPADHPDGSIDHSDRLSVLVKPASEPNPPIPPTPNEPTKGFAEHWAAIRARHVPSPPLPVQDQLVSRGGSAASTPMSAGERSAIITAALGASPAAGDGPPCDPGSAVGPDGHPAPGLRDGAMAAGCTDPAAETMTVGCTDPAAETIAALGRLGPGATRGEVLEATLKLSRLLNDRKSKAYYRKTCDEVARGELPPRVLVAAVGSARGPGIANPGAAFTAHVKRCRAAAGSRR